MAQFNWGQALKAPFPFDQQPYVDDAMHVWQYSTANQAWMRAEHLLLQKSRTAQLICMGVAIGSDLFVQSKRAGTIGTEWDSIYNLCFVEVYDVVSGILLGRRAHMNRAALNAWFATIIPNDGSSYTTNIMLHIYEVVDERAKLVRWNAWNGFYSSFRGRHCYYGDRGYGRIWPNQGPRGGVSDNFQTWHGIDLGNELFNYFFGFYPGSSDSRVCWSAGNRKSTHNTPLNANGIIMNISQTGMGRHAWDWGSSDFGEAQLGDWEIHTAGLIRQNPCHLYRAVDGHTVILSEPRGSMRGCGSLWQSMNGAIEGMLAYCIRNVDNNNQLAFLLKPVGITKCAFVASGGATATTHDVVAVGHFRNRAGDSRFANLSQMGMVENRGDTNGFRITNLMDAVAGVDCGATYRPTAISVDNNLLPTDMMLYLRHKTTGIRSTELTNRIQVVRRKSCMPISLMDRR